jgi:hypothetical protein
MITIGGQAFAVTQDAGAPLCVFSIVPTSQTFDSGGGAGSISVVAIGLDCAWSAAPEVEWISVTGGASGTGNGVVAYSVEPSAGQSRSGTVSVAGQTFTVNERKK